IASLPRPCRPIAMKTCINVTGFQAPNKEEKDVNPPGRARRTGGGNHGVPRLGRRTSGRKIPVSALSSQQRPVLVLLPLPDSKAASRRAGSALGRSDDLT